MRGAPGSGTIVPEQQGEHQEETLARVPNKALPELFPFQTSFQVVPGALPLLRYGTTYRLRAHAVNLAGNSVPPESEDSTLATPPHPYLRFEPLPSPVLILRDWVTEGESLERMVIRSNYDVSAADYVQLPMVQQVIAGQGYHYKPDNERHVAPPKTLQLMAELHGMFDAAMGAGEGLPAVVQPGRQGRGHLSRHVHRRSTHWSTHHLHCWHQAGHATGGQADARSDPAHAAANTWASAGAWAIHYP